MPATKNGRRRKIRRGGKEGINGKKKRGMERKEEDRKLKIGSGKKGGMERKRGGGGKISEKRVRR